jgi:hypothetical protein
MSRDEMALPLPLPTLMTEMSDGTSPGIADAGTLKLPERCGRCAVERSTRYGGRLGRNAPSSGTAVGSPPSSSTG